MQPESMSSSDEAPIGDTGSTVGGTYAERRKSSKPIMEKKRRARINNSLDELKAILLEALKKDSTRHSKLEKADILEMTVKYLKSVERQRLSVSLSIDPSIVDKYGAGFSECRNEVMKFLSTCEGVTVDVRTRLLNHLASCIQSIQSKPNSLFEEPSFDPAPSIQGSFKSSRNTQALSNHNLDGLSSGVYSALQTPKIPIPFSVPGLEANVPAVNAGISGSTPLILQEGLQLTPTINGFSAGNIAFLLPSNRTGTPTALVTSVSSSPEKNSQTAHATQTGFLVGANNNIIRLEDTKSHQESNTFAIHRIPPLTVSPQQPVIINVGGNGPTFSNTALDVQTSPCRLNLHSQVGNCCLNRNVCNSDMNTSLSSNDEPTSASETELTFSSYERQRHHTFQQQKAQISPVLRQDANHKIENSVESINDCSYPSVQKQQNAAHKYYSTHLSLGLPNPYKRKAEGSVEHSLAQTVWNPASSLKRGRQEKSDSFKTSPVSLQTKGSSSSAKFYVQDDSKMEYRRSPPKHTSPLGLNATTSTNFSLTRNVENLRDFNNNNNSSDYTALHVHKVRKSEQKSSCDITSDAGTVSPTKVSPWRPWSETEHV